MEIVTGHRGTPHITPYKVRDFNIGIVGAEDYVINSGSELEAQLVSNNRIDIKDGSICMQGTHAVIPKNINDELTIENGMQGEKRIDLIVARYEKVADSGVESVNTVVLQGTPSKETPNVPGHVVGDIRNGDLKHEMPLYEVKLDGINITEVRPVFKKLVSVAEQQKMIESLNGKIEKPTLYSATEKQIGVTDSGEPVYRKTIRSAMTYFSKPSSGYTDCTISVGAYLKKILRADAHIVKNDNTEMYALPYSATGGSWGTWLRSISSSGSQQSVLHFNNNVTWGSAYTLVVTIDYTK